MKVTFDGEYKIRLFEEAKAARSQDLQSESLQFVEKTVLFNDKVNGLVQVLEAHAERIENQKIRAIGENIISYCIIQLERITSDTI